MAEPTIAVTKLNLRRRVARRLDDNIDGTASGGTATTLTDTGDIDRYPTSPAYLIGAEITTTAGTGLGQSRFITAHTKTGGTVTLTVPSWTAVDSTTDYEIHRISGRGFTKAQYDDALMAAIDACADGVFTDTEVIAWASETRKNHGWKNEYPLPSGFNWVFGVDYLGHGPVTSLSANEFDAWRAMGDATARTRLWQGFQVPQDGWYEWFSLYMDKVGSPTDNLTLQLHTDSSGIPSGTLVSDVDGTGNDSITDNVVGTGLQNSPRNVVFRFDPPIYLTGGTQYHIVLTRSGAVDASNFYRWGEDTGGNYGTGTAGTYNATTYSAVTGSDFIFAVSAASSLWIPFRAKSEWAYRRVGSDFIHLTTLPTEGTPMRIRGGAAIAEIAATTETTDIPIRAEWAEAFAIQYLLSGRAGANLPDNYAEGARMWAANLLKGPRPYRSLPANAVRVSA